MNLSTLFLLFAVPKIVVESSKLSATILDLKFPVDLRQHSVIYDGLDSIFIFTDSVERKDTIFHLNITTSILTVAGEMPEVGEYRMSTGGSGKLTFDGLGNILYFGGGLRRRDICKFNRKNRICENVSTLPFDVTFSSFVEYNDTHILIFGGLEDQCHSVISFNLNTFESNIVKNISSFLCGSIVGKTAYRVLIHDNRNEAVTALDLETFKEKPVSEDLITLNLYSSFTRKGNELCILRGFKRRGFKQVYKHELLTLDLDSATFSFKAVDGFLLREQEFFTEPPAVVFVAKLNRIYLFGGVSVGRFDSLIYHRDIWYIDLNPTSVNNYVLWILFVGMLALLGAGGVIIYVVRKKPLKFRNPDVNTPHLPPQLPTQQETNRVWKSCTPFQLVGGKPIGSGSFAEVYKASHALNPNLHFAVKKIKVYKALKHMEWDLEKILREVVNLSEILNPNVVRMWNCWMEDEKGQIIDGLEQLQFMEWSSTQDIFLFLQMEFCDSTLRDWLKENEALQKRMEKDVSGIMLQIVNGLRGIRKKGIIHRDIKPNNIFHCVNENLWKIGDLGLSAKTTDSSIKEHTVAGCRLYQSPEMANGGKTANYNFKSDVFSLGLTFLELICVFQSEELCSKMFQQIRNTKGKIVLHDIVGIATLPNSNLLELVSKMLTTNPAERIDMFDSTIDSSLH